MCPDKKLRDGRKAVESATKACDLTQWRTPKYVVRLARACTEAGDLESAAILHLKVYDCPAHDEIRATGESVLEVDLERKPC